MVINCAIARSGKCKEMKNKLLLCNFPSWSSVDDFFSQIPQATHWEEFVWLLRFYVDFRDFDKYALLSRYPTLIQINIVRNGKINRSL